MEKKALLVDKTVTYNGIFRADELYQIIRRFFSERGYFMFETQHQEDILEHGKQIYIKMEPTKHISDYAKQQIVLQVFIKGLHDTTITIDNHKEKYQQGNATLKASAFLLSDLRGRWDDSGGRFLFRVIVNRFIKKGPISIAEERTKKDCNDLLNEIRAYLNMNRFKLESKNPEEQKLA